MEGRMRDLDQIQECDPEDAGRRLGTVLLASVAFLAVSAAVGVVVGRAARPDAPEETRDPLAELDRSTRLKATLATAKPAASPKVETTALTFPNSLTEQEERPEVLAALADAAKEQAALDPNIGPQPPAQASAIGTPLAHAPQPAQPDSPASAPSADPERLSAALPASMATGPSERALAEAIKHDSLVDASIPRTPSGPRAPRGQEGDFTLQVISYDSPGPAARFAAGLRDKGHKAFVMEADIPDRGRFYRVRVGPFKTRHEANRYRAEFEATEQMNTYVVKRPRDR